jgi:hypothetical protein
VTLLSPVAEHPQHSNAASAGVQRGAVRNRAPLSIGWLFPPGPSRWLGSRDVTLGWYEDANDLALPEHARAALDQYRSAIGGLIGGQEPSAASIKGLSFAPASVISNGDRMVEPVQEVVAALRGISP